MRIYITLRVAGDSLDPEEITTILGVVPHLSRPKGEMRVSGSKHEIISKFGLWEWRSIDPSKTLSINDHVKRLKSTFEHAYGFLSNLPNAENAWVDVYMVVDDSDEDVSTVWFLMDIETVLTLRNIGLPVEFTIDIFPPD